VGQKVDDAGGYSSLSALELEVRNGSQTNSGDGALESLVLGPHRSVDVTITANRHSGTSDVRLDERKCGVCIELIIR